MVKETKEQRVTYFKRKRGILKKAIELSTICDQDVFMMVLDKKNNRLVEFNSTPDFDIHEVLKVIDK